MAFEGSRDSKIDEIQEQAREIERLRALGETKERVSSRVISGHQARIEKLEAALRHIRDKHADHTHCGNDCSYVNQAYLIACEALEER